MRVKLKKEHERNQKGGGIAKFSFETFGKNKLYDGDKKMKERKTASAFGYPSVYPTGTTLYSPDKCWNGYTLLSMENSLLDMNGNVVNHWETGASELIKALPGGHVLVDSTDVSLRRVAEPPSHSHINVKQLDWGGNDIWVFNKFQQINMDVEGKGEMGWAALQHHDFQREGNPVGYYVPGMDPLVDKGNTLILAHKDVKKPEISPSLLHDDCIYEVTWEGEIIWEWLCGDHFDEFGFSEEAKNTMYRCGGIGRRAGPLGAEPVGAGRPPTKPASEGPSPFDWMHINCISTLGPNSWYDGGDERFQPDNIIGCGRSTNILFIIEKKTGKIVWKVGPDYTASSALRELGQIVGPHHCHMIPRGLPGAGNILVFDNGGAAGYGAPNPGSPIGVNNALRDYSRIIEFDPLTLEKVWEYRDGKRFYSYFISSAQRLPNGNTLICEGAKGRIFEVTREGEIVWEYVSPPFSRLAPKPDYIIYRAYRVPYEWVPQLEKPVEKAVIPPDPADFRIQPQ